MELRLAYTFIAIACSLFGLAFVGLFLLQIPDSETNATIESTIATYFVTSWIIVLELALFLGVLISTIVVLFSVSTPQFPQILRHKASF